MLSIQTLAWQTEENCEALAAGCLSVPHTLENHLGKHRDCLENALQISWRSCEVYWQGGLLVAVAMKIVGIAKLSSCCLAKTLPAPVDMYFLRFLS